MNRAPLSRTYLGKALAAFTFSLVATAHAEPDFRNIAFHPVPLSGENAIDTLQTFQSVSPDAGPVSFADTRLLQTSADKYRTSIHHLETTGGPYNPMVAQESEALGDLLQQADDHAGATTAYEKSLHILRVNEGLYSAGQEKLIRKSIASQMAMGNVGKAGDLHEALLYLQKHLHEKGDEGYIAAILEWADWNVDRLLAGGSGSPRETLNANLFIAQENYIEAIELIRGSGDTGAGQQQGLVHAEKKLAALNYIANSATPTGNMPAASAMSSSTDPFAHEQRRNDSAGMVYFFNGSSALKRAIAYSLESPQPDYLSIAEQMMALGDWYMLFDRRAAALSVYEDAFEVLDAVQASEADIQRIMTPGMPVVLPASGSNTLASSGFAGYIDVEFQVSKFGIASHPEVIATSEQYDSPVTSALIRKIRQEKFRPAFIDGSATSSENVKLRYYYSYN